jgi:hypothetical protein
MTLLESIQDDDTRGSRAALSDGDRGTVRNRS